MRGTGPSWWARLFGCPQSEPLFPPTEARRVQPGDVYELGDVVFTIEGLGLFHAVDVTARPGSKTGSVLFGAARGLAVAPRPVPFAAAQPPAAYACTLRLEGGGALYAVDRLEVLGCRRYAYVSTFHGSAVSGVENLAFRARDLRRVD